MLKASWLIYIACLGQCWAELQWRLFSLISFADRVRQIFLPRQNVKYKKLGIFNYTLIFKKIFHFLFKTYSSTGIFFNLLNIISCQCQWLMVWMSGKIIKSRACSKRRLKAYVQYNYHIVHQIWETIETPSVFRKISLCSYNILVCTYMYSE